MSQVTLVLCTAPEGEAASLAEQLLNDRLVACVNLVGPVISKYLWRGAMEESREVLLVMKTARHLAAALRDRIAELHSYEVPEVLQFDADGGLDRYLEWVVGSCGR